MSKSLRSLLIPFALAAAFLFPTTAQAQSKAKRLMPPSKRPWFFTAGIGPSFYGFFGGRRGGRFGNRGFARGKLALDLGYHFDGTGEGLAIGGALEQTFGNGLFTFSPAFKLWYDIEIADMGIYVTPQVKAGYALGGCDGCDLQHGFNIAIGAEGRVVFKNRWMVYFRPAYFDMYVGDWFGSGFNASYDVLLGGGVTF